MRSMMGITTKVAAAMVVGLGLTWTSISTAATVATQAIPPQSFLNTRVQTVNEMIAQISSNSTVRQRYCKLFKVSSTQLIPYLRKNVVESYVPATKSYKVWCASKDGRLFSINQKFVAGTRVFALRNGTPVMKWACGNPLVSALPAPPAKPQTIAKAPTVPFEKVAPLTETIASEVTPPAPVENLVSVPSEVPTVVPSTLVAGSSEIIVPGSSAKGFIPWIPIAGAAALVSTTLNGSSSPSSKVISFNSSNGGTTPTNGETVVPEPAPIVAMLIGLLPIAFLVALARRNVRNPSLRI
ncbi:MAG: hypothetical protein P4L33_15420 [Capsulimonadaceae bacterium]|nr:hypothetical protein [Capsulimonadaceae bacterium]